jgi:L-threonylcarbamoyladenylate synthase
MQIVPASTEGLQRALDVLRAGGVIAHATETCYGLACDLSNPAAVEKLFAIKQRPPTQPVSALFASIDDAKQYVVWNDEAEELAQQYLPGPLTLILPLREDAPKKLFPVFSILPVRPHPGGHSPFSSLGVRISSHPLAMNLVTAFGSPLSTTSANLHGQPNPYSLDQIVPCDLIIDSGTLPQNPPSTVMDLTGETIEKRRSGDLHI